MEICVRKTMDNIIGRNRQAKPAWLVLLSLSW